jgi:hypothetical protein
LIPQSFQGAILPRKPTGRRRAAKYLNPLKTAAAGFKIFFNVPVLVDRFHLNPSYFPKNTRDLLPAEIILQHGALALGVKKSFRFFRTRRLVNLGFLDPSREESIKQVLITIREKFNELGFQGIQVYQLDPQEFVDVLSTVYQIPESELRRRNPESLNERLRQFLASNKPGSTREPTEK